MASCMVQPDNSNYGKAYGEQAGTPFFQKLRAHGLSLQVTGSAARAIGLHLALAHLGHRAMDYWHPPAPAQLFSSHVS